MLKKDIELLNKAMELANKTHENQTYGNQPFVYHPLQVYEIITLLKPEDINLRCAGLLHDCIESGLKKEEIEKETNEDIASLVEEVTKTGYNKFPNLKTQRGIFLKYVDRMCNLANMQDWSKERIATYLQKSIFWKS